MAEKLTTEEILREFGRTNINNIKHIKHNIKNLNTINDFTSSGNHQIDDFVQVASPPEASSSSQEKPIGVALATMAARPWRFIKADLFDNATPQQLAKNKRKFNLKLAFLLKNKPEYQYLAAALNTPWRNVKRGFDFSESDQLSHYTILEEVYQAMSKCGLDRIRASKCYEPSSKGKGATIYGMSVVMGQDLNTGTYILAVIKNTKVYTLELSGKTITEAQRSANCIATAQEGEMSAPRKTARDFFGE
jgi:hypothetical protein